MNRRRFLEVGATASVLSLCGPNPLTANSAKEDIEFQGTPAQTEFLRSTNGVCLYVANRRRGKTRLCVYDLVRFALGADGFRDYLLVAPNSQMVELAMARVRDLAFRMDRVGPSSRQWSFTLANGSTIYGASCDNLPRASGFSGVWLEEPALMATNPIHAIHRINVRDGIIGWITGCLTPTSYLGHWTWDAFLTPELYSSEPVAAFRSVEGRSVLLTGNGKLVFETDVALHGSRATSCISWQDEKYVQPTMEAVLTVEGAGKRWKRHLWCYEAEREQNLRLASEGKDHSRAIVTMAQTIGTEPWPATSRLTTKLPAAMRVLLSRA